MPPEERGFLLVISSRQVTRGGTRKQYAAFLFDMDGVLIHSTPVHNESWQLYLREHGVHEDRRSIESKMLGKHNEEIVRIFFGENLSPAEIFRHGAEKEKVYRRLMKPRFAEYLVPGIREFLERHRNVPMGVASNAEAPNIDFVLDTAGIRPYFRAIIDGHQVERPKPAPDIYLRVAETLNVDPVDCIVFEDSGTGVTAARKAGARVVGVATTTAELEGCDLIISDFLSPELESWLAQFQLVCQ